MNDPLRDELIEDLKNLDFKRSFGAETAKLEIGALLYKVRKNANLTQKELSEKLGVKQPYIARLEAGEANPTISAIGNMLAMLDLRLAADVRQLVQQTASDTFFIKQQEPIDATISMDIDWRKFLQSNTYSVDQAGDIQQNDRDLVPAAI